MYYVYDRFMPSRRAHNDCDGFWYPVESDSTIYNQLLGQTFVPLFRIKPKRARAASIWRSDEKISDNSLIYCNLFKHGII